MRFYILSVWREYFVKIDDTTFDIPLKKQLKRGDIIYQYCSALFALCANHMGRYARFVVFLYCVGSNSELISKGTRKGSRRFIPRCCRNLLNCIF